MAHAMRPVPHRALLAALVAAAPACAQRAPTHTPTHGDVAAPDAHDLVMEAAACWMGGLWSDALGESGFERYAAIERRCDALLREVDLTAPERPKAVAAGVPQPQPEEGYYPLRAVEPHIVDTIAHEVQLRAERHATEGAHAADLVALLRAIAAATRETVQARRAADKVKNDVLAQPSAAAREANRQAATEKLAAGDALRAILHVDAGRYTDEARAIGVLSALDRMEIASSLPKHLKFYVLSTAYAEVFGVAAPDVPPEVPLEPGTWLTYITQVAKGAGHPVPSDAHDPQNREPLAWAGVLEGFADKLRDDVARFPAGSALGNVERRVIARLDDEFRDQREIYDAHAPADR
jgi:hypothetical protein